MPAQNDTLPRLNILHTESSCGWGGQEIRTLTEAAGMIARGHQVALACPPEAKIFVEAPRFGVPAHPLPMARKNLGGVLALRRLIKALGPDVVNTHSSTDSWLAALAGATLADAPPAVRTRHISSPIPDNLATRWLYRHAPRHVVTTGEALRTTLIAQLGLAPDRVTSVPTGIDTARFQPGDKSGARAELGLDPALNYVGIVATLRSWKGHSYLIDAFAQLDAPGWQLLIVGGGPQMDNLSAQIQALGAGGRVRLMGEQRNAERWMQALDLFCLPSYANEGVPQAIMQAMLTGLPIVTTPVGAILEAVTDGETALVIQPRNAEAIAGALHRLMQDAPLRSTLGQHARQAALARFSLDTMLDRMEQVFHRAIQAGKP